MITAAAIIQNGVLYSGIPFKDRHHNVIRIIVDTAHIKPVTGEQGFIDEKGWFYDREEAAKHAIECGQVETGKAKIRHIFNGYELYSEDLW